jgi:hypothetical protein
VARFPGVIYESLLALAPSAHDTPDRKGDAVLPERGGRISRKSTGTYYTPGPILERMAEEAFAPLLTREEPLAKACAILDLKVLDPAMGSGHFLVTAVDHLARAFREALPEEESITVCRRKIAAHCIFGVDLDPLALDIARQSLDLFTFCPESSFLNLDHRLKKGDALFGVRADRMESDFTRARADEAAQVLYAGTARERGTALEPPYKTGYRSGGAGDGLPAFFHWELAFPEVFERGRDPIHERGGFDVILGNPPYGDLLTPWGKEALMRFGYPPTGGRAEIAAHFIHQGLNLLAESGRLLYILPNTLIDGRQFSRSREAITRRARVVSITDFPDRRVFPDAGVHGMILHLAAEPDPPAAYHALYCRPGQEKDGGGEERMRVRSGTGEPWRRIVPFVERLREKGRIEHLSPDIAECRDAGLDYKYRAVGWDRRGERPRLGNRLTYEGPKRQLDDKPLIRGRDIQPYHIGTPARHLKHDWASFRSKEVVVQVYPELAEIPVKIVTRQTSDRLIAALDRTGCYTAKSVHTLIVRNPAYSPEYICALLNSGVMNEIYAAFTGERGRIFAQVKVSDLRILPVLKVGSIATGRTHPLWLEKERAIRNGIREGDTAPLRAFSDRLMVRQGQPMDGGQSGVVQAFVTEVVEGIEALGVSGEVSAARNGLMALLDDLFSRLYKS